MMAGSGDGERLVFWFPADGSEAEQLLRQAAPALRRRLRKHGLPEDCGVRVEEANGGIQLVVDRTELRRGIALRAALLKEPVP